MIGLLWKCCVFEKSSTPKKTPFLFVLLSAVLLIHATDTHADDALTEFGDYMQIVLPGLGLANAVVRGDWEGAKQWGYTGATSIVITGGMKAIYGKTRPKGLFQSGTQQSFPSGHTSAAFFGAGFLDQRYGKWWGIPAYAAAAVTGYSRVDADAHHVDDVLMGASVGLMSSLLWTTPYESAVSLIPFQSNDGGGIKVSFNGNDKPDTYEGLNDNDRWRYAIVFGPAWQQENKIISPVGVGTEKEAQD